MSHLSGKLETFSLRQILVLMADAGVTGELQVGSTTQSGRIFFQSGSVAYGTTRAGEESISELDRLFVSHDAQAAAEAPDRIKEQLIEALHGLSLLESGSFEFIDGAMSKLDVGPAFTVVELLRLVDDRAAAWEKVRKVIPTNTTQLALAPELSADRSEVMVDKESWSMLATVSGGSSISEVARLRGTSDFQAAKSLAELVKWGLITTDEAVAPRSELSGTGIESTTVKTDLPSSKPELPALQSELPEPKSGLAPSVRSARRTAAFARLEALEQPKEDQTPEAEEKPAPPRVDPKVAPVSFSKKDLTEEERNELIRNIGKGIYPSD